MLVVVVCFVVGVIVDSGYGSVCVCVCVCANADQGQKLYLNVSKYS